MMTHGDVIILENMKLMKNPKTNYWKKNFKIPLIPDKIINDVRFTPHPIDRQSFDKIRF